MNALLILTLWNYKISKSFAKLKIPFPDFKRNIMHTFSRNFSKKIFNRADTYFEFSEVLIENVPYM